MEALLNRVIGAKILYSTEGLQPQILTIKQIEHYDGELYYIVFEELNGRYTLFKNQILKMKKSYDNLD